MMFLFGHYCGVKVVASGLEIFLLVKEERQNIFTQSAFWSYYKNGYRIYVDILTGKNL